MADPAEARSYSLAAYGRLLSSNRNFRLLWSAQIISELGDWLYAVAIYSLLLELTGEAKSVGLAVVLQLMPQVFIAPTAGVLNDRLNRRAIMIVADCCRVLVVLSMLFVKTASMVWLVYVLLLVETLMWALFEPGRSALVPNVARDEGELSVANALSSSTWAITFALGSGIGGLVSYHAGREALFVMNAASFIVSALLLGRMQVTETHAEGQPPFRLSELIDFRPVLDGMRYMLSNRRLLATMSVKVGMGLMGAHWVILPVLGEQVFPLGAKGGALSMSLLMSARGVGSLIGSSLSGYWARNDQARMRMGIFWSFLFSTAAGMLLAGAPTLALACLAVAASHAGSSTTWVLSTTMLQSMTEDRFRGRVFSADFSGLFLLMSAVSYASSQAVDAGVSIRVVAFCAGAVGIIPAAAWLACQRLWRRG